MKILIYYILILLLSMPWCSDDLVSDFAQISYEIESNFPDQEKENEDVESYSDVCCINPTEKIHYLPEYFFFKEVLNTIPQYKKHWWVQTVFAPPETC